MLSTTFITSVLSSLILLQVTSASPLQARDTTQYPEVIPGPGLPSLEALGLTTAQLYETPLPPARTSTSTYPTLQPTTSSTVANNST
jgi:hypothetical protein